MTRLPPLSALRAFEAVARLGSVGAAAAALGRTPGAVSKQLKSLADESGLVLFDKVGTGLRANATGQRLAAAVGEAFARLGSDYDALVRAARAPGVHVACSASFAMGWLVGALPQFSALYPDIRIRLSMTSAREMREEREADLVVLWDQGAYPAADRGRAIRLADAAFGVVAAPGYGARVEDGVLTAHCQIRHEHTARAWEAWGAATGLRVAAGATMSFPHTHLCLGAAAAGMGVAIAERRMVAAGLAAGTLETVGPFAPFAGGLVAIPHGQRAMGTETERFVAWLKGAMGASFETRPWDRSSG